MAKQLWVFRLMRLITVSLCLICSTVARAELIAIIDFSESGDKQERPLGPEVLFTDLMGISDFNVTISSKRNYDLWIKSGVGLGNCLQQYCTGSADTSLKRGLVISFSYRGMPLEFERLTLFFDNPINDIGNASLDLYTVEGTWGAWRLRSIWSTNPYVHWNYNIHPFQFTFVDDEYSDIYLRAIYAESIKFPTSILETPSFVLFFLPAIAIFLRNIKRCSS
ncbi:hypothetical protein FE810_02820 [Thalassotalea litorea]|uniref:PEP-CTERM sorting domain-containing protein n=1 Tax=Thalassotalea litorea TaxID=2020715 RepID=A0A5R9IPM6_9GAMM|nr:hypothetical protein [Thalassotalea litorea]TLU67232.1 hypothetical protein FE810_02820 [Thalassotalea litorea]